MKQNLGPLGDVDMLTAKELHDSLGHHFDIFTREHFRGMKLIRMAPIRVTSTGGTITIGSNTPGENNGPQQGYIWRISRLMVASSSIADTARYILYAGSDATAQDPLHMLDAQVGAPVPVFAPAVPASGTAQFNNSPNPTLVQVSGGTVTGISVNGTPTGATSGGFYVPAGGSITLTYSVAPTWAWSNPFLGPGQLVNVAFRPGNRAEWIWPGEFPYASVTSTSAGTQYYLTGIATEVPMEMMGKIL
jgi:hypothetical protein